MPTKADGAHMPCFAEMKVAQLKEECRSRGLKISGLKKELVDRLRSDARSHARAVAASSAAKPCAVSAHKLPDIETLVAEKVCEDGILEVARQETSPNSAPGVFHL